MLIEILNKLLTGVFFLTVLNTVRHAYFFIQALIVSTDEEPRKYKLTKRELLLLGISVAYILAVIFTGIKL
jgi:hypothetical protein